MLNVIRTAVIVVVAVIAGNLATGWIDRGGNPWLVLAVYGPLALLAVCVIVWALDAGIKRRSGTSRTDPI